MIRAIYFLPVFLFIGFLLSAQTTYLKVDASCMNRLEYVSSKDAVPFIVYSFFLGNQKMAFMDIGKEGGSVVREIKEKVYSCQELLIDKTLVQNINTGSVKLVMVNEKPGFYELNLVNQAGFIEHIANTLEMFSPEASFLFYTDNLVSSQNLAKPDSKMEVYFEGIAPAQCINSYAFKFKEDSKSSNYSGFTLIPGVGLVEKKSITVAGFFTDESTNTITLSKVNQHPFRDYLTMFCDRKQSEYYEGKTMLQPSVYSELVPKAGETSATALEGDPCSPPTQEGVHTVQKGETMYGIARRYGISLEQLREWNKLVDTEIISPCQKLFVKQSSSASAALNNSNSTSVSTRPVSAGELQSSQKLHVVLPGETVAMLAKMFGYTEERFRRMNSLSPVEELHVGQKLHTGDCICPNLVAKDALAPTNAALSASEPIDKPSDVHFRPVQVHLVQKNDSLFSIAQKYNTTPERIMELNGMKKGDSIKLNQRLYVQ